MNSSSFKGESSIDRNTSLALSSSSCSVKHLAHSLVLECSSGSRHSRPIPTTHWCWFRSSHKVREEIPSRNWLSRSLCRSIIHTQEISNKVILWLWLWRSLGLLFLLLWLLLHFRLLFLFTGILTFRFLSGFGGFFFLSLFFLFFFKFSCSDSLVSLWCLNIIRSDMVHST